MSPSTNADAHYGTETRSAAVSLQHLDDAGTETETYLWVSVPAPGPAVRGRLALFVEGAIERTLESKGAPPPGIGASANLAESLDDQLTRTRLTGTDGLALRFSSLRGVTDADGAFDTHDSSVLRWLLRAPRRRALRVLFAEADSDLRVFDQPVRLGSLIALSEGHDRASEHPPTASPEVLGSVEAMALSPDVACPQDDDRSPTGSDAGRTPPPEDLRSARAVSGSHETEEAVSVPRAERDHADDRADLAPSAERDHDDDRDADLAVAPAVEEGIEGSDDLVEPTAADLALAHSERLTEELLEELERATLKHEEDLCQSARALMEDVSEVDWLHETLVHLSTPPPASGVSERPGAEMADVEALTGDHAAMELTPASIDDFLARPAAPSLEEDAPNEEDESGRYARLPTAEPIDDGLTRTDASDPSATATDAPGASTDIEAPQTDDSDVGPAEAPGEVGAAADRIHDAEQDVVAETAEVAAPEPPDPELVARCEAWERELSSSNGPKPLSVIERQFTSAYTPLRDAVDRGAGSDQAREVLDEWAASFAKSYSEAFEVLRYRGKRPSMVLDLPDLSVRIARLHGARSTQLLLVDGMRFDVGLQVDERLRGLVGGRAACAERLLLWSALPTTTAAQLELIGRGPMGLRELSGIGDEEMLVARGRKASTLRRLRTGQRELLKLDIVESRLSEPGGPAQERIAEAADEVAERLAAHFEGVPDRTLVVVFGDHGFVLDPRDGGGTQAARQGGASPEEVLVPAFAWIVGAVH